jgi:hypothetical protein
MLMRERYLVMRHISGTGLAFNQQASLHSDGNGEAWQAFGSVLRKKKRHKKPWP